MGPGKQGDDSFSVPQHRYNTRLVAKLAPSGRAPVEATPLATAREEMGDANIGNMAQRPGSVEEGLRERAADFAARSGQADARMERPGTPYAGTAPAGSTPAQRSQHGRSLRHEAAGLNLEMERDKRMMEMEQALNQVMRAQASGGTGYMFQQVEAPPPFDGSRARSWLRQIEQYFNNLRLPEEERLRRIINHMTGEALDHYCATAERNPELMPTSWGDLREFIIDNFGSVPTLSVIRQLRSTNYRGNVQEIAKKFAIVLSQGEQPSDQQLIKIFLSRFSWEMVKEADRMRI